MISETLSATGMPPL